MRTRHTALTAATTALLLALTACSSDTATPTGSSTPTPARQLDTAQDITDALTKAGFTITPPQEETDESYITQVGGTAYDFTVTDQDDQPAPGNAGINLFPNPEALATWIPLSKSFGGIAVTRDTWAISLPTRTKDARTDSQRLAPKIADALDGTVQR